MEILYSPGYGAGWVSCNDYKRELCVDTVLVGLVKKGGHTNDGVRLQYGDCASAAFKARAEEICGHQSLYFGGVEQLQVLEIPDGSRFRITEYDGYESVLVEGDDEGWM